MSWASDASGRARRAARLACNKLGRLIVDDIRSTIEEVGPPPDRSEPDEPPFYVRGDLWKSIKYRVEAGAKSYEALEVYQDPSIAPHGPWLEAGTRKMEPRPYFEPARKRWKRYMNTLFKSFFSEFYNGD